VQLTRRDALVALAGTGAAAGAVAVGGLVSDQSEDTPSHDAATETGPRADTPTESAEHPFTSHQRDTAAALARILYPDAVTGIHAFVETYLDGLATDRPDHAAAVGAAVGTLDEYCRTWWGRPFLSLPTDRQERVPSEMGLSITDPRPAGTDRERVRYYLVDELLYALYASPTGGRLLGIENPPGHPGGLDSYQRGPDGE
jgi:hypothetical protein